MPASPRAGRPPALAALLVALVPAVALGHGDDDHEGPAAPARAPGGAFYFPKESQFLLGVRTAPAAARAVISRLEVPGKVVPRTDRHAEVFAPVAGRISAVGGRLPFVGARVRRGQTLAVLEQILSAPEGTQLAAERIKAESAVTQARAALEQARRDQARLASLAGVVAARETQQADLAVRQATEELARVERERSLYAAAGGGGTRQARFTLQSPIDGVIVDAAPAVGEQVEPARPLYTIIDTAVVWVEAAVFSDDVARIEASREALVHVDAYPDRYFPAALFNLSPVVDEATRTVKAIFEVKNADGRLRPGMFASVAIGAAAGAETALAIPDAAIVEAEGRRVVYLHAAPEDFVAREVVLGPRDAGFVVIRRGLEEGDRVVVSGTGSLRAAEGGR